LKINAAMISAPIVLAPFPHNRRIYSLDPNQFGGDFFLFENDADDLSFGLHYHEDILTDGTYSFAVGLPFEIFLINRLILTIPYPFTAGYQRYDEKDLI